MLFTVKAPNSITLTHSYSRQSKAYREYANRPNEHFLSPKLLVRFLDALSPMKEKLGPVMFQFEYLNRKKMPSMDAFLERLHVFFADAPSDYQYAIETRNPNYLSPPFFDFLREHGLGFVFLDGYYMPPIGEVFEKHGAVTTEFSIIRLHGGDREGIEASTGKDWSRIIRRQPEGIGAAAAIARSNALKGVLTIVNVNNHYEGSAHGPSSDFWMSSGGRVRKKRSVSRGAVSDSVDRRPSAPWPSHRSQPPVVPRIAPTPVLASRRARGR